MNHADSAPNPVETARLLRELAGGDRGAAATLLPILYRELHGLAERMMAGESGHTLQPTALVHEAWLRLAPREQGWENRKHFLQFAAKAMRSVLVDHARAARAEKRGGDRNRITLQQDLLAGGAGPEELLSVDEALNALMTVDEQLAQIVELRVFAGLGHRETADSLGVSLRTVERGWRLARAWLIKHMGATNGESGVD